MIIPSLGKLAVAQTLTNSNEISENVIELAQIDFGQITDAWWVVDTNLVATGDGSDSIKIALVVATAAGLGTSLEVCSVLIEDITDLRVATAGRHIVALNVGKMLKDMLDTDGSDYEFIGMKNTLTSGTTISIDAVLSTTEPQTESHRMVTESGVGIPAVASAASGFVP